jgi:hypothetical protein
MNNPTRPDADYYMRLLVDRVPTMLAYWAIFAQPPKMQKFRQAFDLQ